MTKLDVSNGESNGDWHAPDFCKAGTFAVGYTMKVRDLSIFIGGLGPVQKAIGHILFSAKMIIELELFSTSAMIGY